jgi:hypothetical protein
MWRPAHVFYICSSPLASAGGRQVGPEGRRNGQNFVTSPLIEDAPRHDGEGKAAVRRRTWRHPAASAPRPLSSCEQRSTRRRGTRSHGRFWTPDDPARKRRRRGFQDLRSNWIGAVPIPSFLLLREMIAAPAPGGAHHL